MALIFQSWLNEAENLNRPLHDLATRRGDGGVLPNDFITDAHLYMPSSLGKNVFIVGASCSQNLVTLVLAACEEVFCTPVSSLSSSTTGLPYTPIASLSLAKPVTPYSNYAITPLQAGVAGWVSFGRAVIDKTFSIKFDNPQQSAFLERAVYSLEDVPVISLGKAHVTPLSGLIKLKGKPGAVTIVKKTMTVDGVSREVAAVGVDPAGGVSLLEDLAGACGHRPQALNCNKRVITSINGVIPDCNGNVDLEFLGGIIVGEVGNGLVLDFPLGMHDVCDTIDPSSVPNQPSDICGSMAPVPEPVPPGPTPEGSSIVSSSSSLAPGGYCEDFETDPPAYLEQRVGSFTNVAYGGGRRWQANYGALGAAGVDLHHALIYDGWNGIMVSATVRPMSMAGEGHVIFAYHEFGVPKETVYLLFGVDLANSRFFIAKKGTAVPNSFDLLLPWAQSPALVVDDYVVSVLITKSGPNDVLLLGVVWNGGLNVFSEVYTDIDASMSAFYSYGKHSGVGITPNMLDTFATPTITRQYSGVTLFDDFCITPVSP